MNVTVIGSTGRTGAHVLIEGARRGHRITAFTRRPQALRDRGTLVAQIVQGDGRDPVAVAEAVTGADAVIAILGPASRIGPHQSADVARVITLVMKQLCIRRLITTSAYPIVAVTPRLPLAVLRLAFADAYADAAQMEHVITSTDLDWTIARLNRLTNGPVRGQYRLNAELLRKPTAVTRADAASSLLDLAESADHLKEAVNIAGPTS